MTSIAAIRLTSATIMTAAATTICKCPNTAAARNRTAAATARSRTATAAVRNRTAAAKKTSAAASAPRTTATDIAVAVAAASAIAFLVFSAAADEIRPITPL